MKTIKKTITTIPLVLVLTTSLFIMFLPASNAQEVNTYAYIAVFPNPIGIGQLAVVNMWVQPLQPTEADVYHELMLTVTKPDGTTETVGPFTTQTTGSTWYEYTPETVGTYGFQFSFPGETFTSTGEYYRPATSQMTELVVQEEPIPPYQTQPLPTGFWERPISAENREWSSISGNWLMDGYNSSFVNVYCSGVGYNPYSEAPKSPHIMWTRELMQGGLVGGEYGGTSYYTGQDYESHLTPPIIMNGRLYYRIYENEFRDPIRPGFVCVDLRTGQELWRKTEDTIDIGQLYDYRSGNQMGVTPWLWDIGFRYYGAGYPHTYKMYDAFTGDLILSFENAITGGIPVYDEHGALHVYYLDGVNNWFAMWNQTKAFEANGIIYATDSGVGYLRPSSPWYVPTPQGTYEWSTGIEWNVTIPDTPDYPGDIWFGDPLGQRPISVMGNVMFVVMETYSHSYHEIGYDINTGERLWIHDTTQWTWMRACGEGVYADFNSPSRTWTGYDVNTGQKLWQSDPPQDYPWGLYVAANTHIADGKLLVPSYDGCVHAYDITNGKQVWKFYGGDTSETPYGTYPFYYGPMSAGGVVFAGQSEHSPTQPFLRGLRFYAIDADTGDGIWSIAGSMSPAAIADGYLLTVNGYDNRLYCFGKGPSSMTLEAPKTAVPKGTPVMITGTVTDQSAGVEGTPAISDEDMSAWMEYLYMQKPKPEDIKGVTVKLYAVDSNDVYHDIGEATSDVWGNFGESWVPPAEDDYQIVAEFEGSNSYGESSASTYLTVGPAPSPETPITPEPEPEAPLITTEVAIILAVVAVAVIAVVGYWILKKRQ